MYKSKQIIVMRKDLGMRKGKIAAQASHASTDVILKALLKEDRLNDIILKDGNITLNVSTKPHTPLSQWFENGVAKICVYVNSEVELLDIYNKLSETGIVSSLIKDAGITEFHGIPTYTCLAIEPMYPDQIDSITGKLSLL
ncbi:MAG: aminoacyl-tRNA hydrolase [Cellulosilyticaceae bacterium]